MTTHLTTGSIAKYTLLPRIVPRFGQLFLAGFDHIAFLMAQIYSAVRLLPPDHPYLSAANIGKYNIRQVIAAAAGHLKFRRENIDQILVFFVLLMGMALLAVQTVLLLGSMFMPLAVAGPVTPLSFGYYFGQPTYGGAGASQDLAFILLDRVFGVPGIFKSCVDPATATPCYGTLPNLTFDTTNPIYTPATFPWPYHVGLHAMMEFYSIGLLVVACFIILYFIIVIVAETAQTGTPFGKRFNSVWAPLRLVVALGLLIPTSLGLNSAQYIVLYMAKFGSNFASNGWIYFNAAMAGWGSAQALNIVAKPQTPPVENLLQFMMLAHACKALEEGFMVPPKPIEPPGGGYSIQSCTGIDAKDDGYNDADTKDNSEVYIDAYLVKFDLSGTGDAVLLADTTADDARTFFSKGDMVIRFGDRGCEYTSQLGRVLPLCGEVVIPTVNPSDSASEAGSTEMQVDYYELVRWLWGWYSPTEGETNHYRPYEFCNPDDMNPRFFAAGMEGDMEIRKGALGYVQSALCGRETDEQTRKYSPIANYTPGAGTYYPVPSEDWRAAAEQNYREGEGIATGPAYPAQLGPITTGYPGAQAVSNFDNGRTVGPNPSPVIAENIVRAGVLAQVNAIASGAFDMNIDAQSRGWAGAGMWYNQLARINGSITAAAVNYPEVSHYPLIMESILAKNRQNNENTAAGDEFNPNLGGAFDITLERGVDENRAGQILNKIKTDWDGDRDLHKPTSGNVILDFINSFFGIKGLFSLDDPVNQAVSPLGLLSGLGKSMVEGGIRALGGGIVTMLGGALPSVVGVASETVSSVLFLIAGIILSSGITLYYVLPFLPFVYFFFAVGNWLKGIFEAMVGVPLWALAHIRIDGNGLPGEAAMNGYYMIFEIFLRPILILFGLLASVSIFQAMASVLNGIWPLATKNVSGSNFDNAANTGWVDAVRGPIDQLFFTVMYAVVLYIMALSSFKLIDLIPNQIMRWLGSGVSSFSDMTGDSAAQLSEIGSRGGSQMTQQAIGGIQQGGQGVKSILQAAGNAATPKS